MTQSPKPTTLEATSAALAARLYHHVMTEAERDALAGGALPDRVLAHVRPALLRHIVREANRRRVALDDPDRSLREAMFALEIALYGVAPMRV